MNSRVQVYLLITALTLICCHLKSVIAGTTYSHYSREMQLNVTKAPATAAAKRTTAEIANDIASVSDIFFADIYTAQFNPIRVMLCGILAIGDEYEEFRKINGCHYNKTHVANKTSTTIAPAGTTVIPVKAEVLKERSNVLVESDVDAIEEVKKFKPLGLIS